MPTDAQDTLEQRLRDADRNSVQRTLGSGIFGEAAVRIAMLEAALKKIAREQHEPGCKFDFAPFVECPTCAGPATIARAALQKGQKP